jgi:hypothetical protein
MGTADSGIWNDGWANTKSRERREWLDDIMAWCNKGIHEVTGITQDREAWQQLLMAHWTLSPRTMMMMMIISATDYSISDVNFDSVVLCTPIVSILRFFPEEKFKY